MPDRQAEIAMKSGWKWVLLAGVCVGAIAAALWLRLRPATVLTDADQIRTPAEQANPRDVLWQPPVLVSDLINACPQTYEPRLGWDGLTLYFVRGKAGENADIYLAQRTPTGWSPAQALTEINSACDELGPAPSADGSRLYFYSDRQGGSGGYDIWVVERSDNGWRSPMNLGPLVNSEFNDYGPAPSPDGRTLLFASNRPQAHDSHVQDPHAWSATVREDFFRRSYDLYRTQLSENGPSQAEPVAVLNTAFNDAAPAFSPAGDFLYFASDRPNGLGGFDIYRSRIVRGVLKTPENLGAPVNSAASELDPGLTQLGYVLYFSSNRDQGTAAPDSNRQAGPKERFYQIYHTSSREVFAEAEAREPIDWAAIAALAPNIAYFLLALLAVLLLLFLMRDVRNRRLSLLTRCLLASLLAHSLLMLSFTFWRVAKGVGGVIRGSGAAKVSLVSAGGGGRDSLYSQLRGGFTDPTPADSLPAQAIALNRPVPVSAAEVRPTTIGAPRSTIDLVASAMPRVESAAPSPSSALMPSGALALAVFPSASVALPDVQPGISHAETKAAAAESVVDTGGRRLPPDLKGNVAPDLETTRIDVPGTGPTHIAPPERGLFASLADATTGSAPLRDAGSVAPPLPLPQREHRALAVAVPSAEGGSPKGAPQAGELSAQVDPLAHESIRPGLFPTASQPAEVPTMAMLPAPASDSALNAEAPPMPDTFASRSTEFRGSLAGASSNVQSLPEFAHASIETLGIPVIPAQQGEPGLIAHESEADDLAATISPAPPDTSALHRDPPAITTAANGPALIGLQPGVSDLSAGGDAAALGSAAALSDASDSSPGTADVALVLPQADYAGAGLITDVALALPDAGPDPAAGEPTGVLHGRVTSAASGEPLSGATVRLDLADREPVTAQTDAAGLFRLEVPEAPENFAVSVKLEGFVPAAANIAGDALRAGGVHRDFELRPISDMTVALEKDPVVHHLGNDAFEGRINSQFQRDSEGLEYVAEFSLRESQVAPFVSRASLVLLAKGVQCPHPVYVNGRRLAARFSRAPADGSFGEASFTIPPHLLRPGNNTLMIEDIECTGDLDDFEFINPVIVLTPSTEARSSDKYRRAAK